MKALQKGREIQVNSAASTCANHLNESPRKEREMASCTIPGAILTGPQ